MYKSGIYQIRNKVNGKLYIGSTFNLVKRESAHFSAFSRGDHPNKYLQMSVNKYGVENFEFKIIFLCSPENRLFYEQKYLDYYSIENLYNLQPKAGGALGWKHSEETRKKMRGKNNPFFGKKHSEETKKRISDKNKGKPGFFGEKNPMYGKNGSLNHFFGRTHSEEARKRISDKAKGRKVSEETKRKISAAHKGRKVSEETKRKISDSKCKKIICVNEEYKETIFRSITECAICIGINRGTIRKNLGGKVKNPRCGYTFKYAEELNE